MPLDPDDIGDAVLGHRLSGLMMSITEHDLVRHEPPPGLWLSVADRIAGDVAPGITVVDPPPQVITDLEGERRRRDRRRGTPSKYLFAAAAVVVAASIGSALFVRSRQPTDRVTASAALRQLEPLGKTSASVRLITRDGSTRLVVDAKNMPPAPPGESYELWLIDPDVSDPVSLGVVTGSGEVAVPSSIDLETHPVVDISLEPNNGDHRHSGHSLMRGTLS